MAKLFLFFFTVSLLFAEEKKINVAVLDLEGESLSAEERTALTNKLILELSKTEQYNIIERTRIKDILKEQGFQQSVCNDQSCLVEMGQLLGVGQLVTGSIVKFGNLYSLYVKIMNVGTGEILRNVNLELTVSMEEVLTQGIKQAVNQLTKSKEESKKTEAFSLKQTQSKLKTSNLIMYSGLGAVAVAGGAWIYFLSKASGSYDDYQSAESDFDSKYSTYEGFQSKSLGTGVATALILPAPVYFWFRSDKLKKQIEAAH